MDSKPAIDQLFEDVAQTFWFILFCYVVVSMAWIFYNIYIHHLELNVVEKKIKQNGVARSLELQRLLDAYNRVNAPPSDPPCRPPDEQV